jgi:hypothetical protein
MNLKYGNRNAESDSPNLVHAVIEELNQNYD